MWFDIIFSFSFLILLFYIIILEKKIDFVVIFNFFY
jgi:hypothetical protein